MSNYNSLPISLWPPGSQVLATDIYVATDTTDIGPTHPSGTTKKYTMAQLLTFVQTEPVELWVTISGTSENALVNAGYVVGNASQTTITLPATCNVGDTIRVLGLGAGGWVAHANTGQVIQFGDVASSSGGTWTSTDANDSATFTCRVANTNWLMISGNTFTPT